MFLMKFLKKYSASGDRLVDPARGQTGTDLTNNIYIFLNKIDDQAAPRLQRLHNLRRRAACPSPYAARAPFGPSSFVPKPISA